MAMTVVGPLSSGVAAGANGSATANLDSTHMIVGLLLGIYIEYLDSPPAGTTDAEITTKGSSVPAYDLLKVSNAATDGLFTIKKLDVSQAGAALTDLSHSPLPVHDYVNVKIAGANAGDSINVYLFLEKD